MKKFIGVIFIVILLTGCSNELELKYIKLSFDYDKLVIKHKELKETLKSIESDNNALNLKIVQKDKDLLSLEKELEVYKQEYDKLIKKSQKEIALINSVENTCDNRNIVFGCDDILIGVPEEFFYNCFYRNIFDNEDYIKVEDYDKFKNGFSPKFMQKVEESKKFDDIKQLFNKEYSIYNDNKFICKINGRLSINDRYEPILVFDNPNLEGFYISGDYNHIPRKVNTILDVTSQDTEKHILTENPKIIEKFYKLGKNIVPNNMDIVITQIIECDLNGDGKLEKIVNYSNAYKDYNHICDFWSDINYSKYYTITTLFDDNYQLIDYIHNIINIEDVKEYGKLFSQIIYIIDIDNDNKMEIISKQSGWGGTTYFIDNLNMNDRKIEGEIYYKGYYD
ncbi:hypothetical protein [Abyssisolibacter fermentans]|uniref:hypothetical protein n=1 Tax=Abyssisolibacter fermentans TaxID=1766203 RepID=UPI00082DD59A|nr:hypothetical protein [Abyssisolibacter fermentans]